MNSWSHTKSEMMSVNWTKEQLITIDVKAKWDELTSQEKGLINFISSNLNQFKIKINLNLK